MSPTSVPGLGRVKTDIEGLNAHDIDDAGQIVGEDVQCHFGGDLRQALHQEVSCAHPHLQRAERMLHRLASLTHFLWMFVEPALHRFYNMFMLPARDLAVFASRASAFNGAVPASIGPIAVQD